MSDLPSMPLFIDDYEAATAHLTMEEDGAYNRLLRLCWRQTDCSIPTDEAWIIRRMRCDKATFARVIKPILIEFFTRSRSRWFQKRLRAEHAYVLTLSNARREAGKKGGSAKAAKSKGKYVSNATKLPEQNPNTALAPIPIPIPIPILIKKSSSSRGREGKNSEEWNPDNLLDEVLSAAGLKGGIIPSRWMPPSATIEVWRWVTDLHLTPEDVIETAHTVRARHQEPPHGPKALELDMRRLAAAKSAPPLTPADAAQYAQTPNPQAESLDPVQYLASLRAAEREESET